SVLRSGGVPVHLAVIAKQMLRQASWFAGSAASTSMQIDSASSGWFRKRYRSALLLASVMPALVIVLGLYSMVPTSRQRSCERSSAPDHNTRPPRALSAE